MSPPVESRWPGLPPLPRAPSEERWAAMTPEERRAAIEDLPRALPIAYAPPEGDLHQDSWIQARDELRRWFRSRGRRAYVGGNILTAYPDEELFTPDVFVVFDVDDKPRNRWVVSAEGKGLEFVLEVHVAGDLKKDLERNVAWYARLGIPEYFVFDRGRESLRGFRLPRAGARAYSPILGNGGHYESQVLGLELALEGDRLRFLVAGAPLPGAEDLITRLSNETRDAVRRLEQEQEAREQERRTREAVEERLAAALADLDRLKKQ